MERFRLSLLDLLRKDSGAETVEIAVLSAYLMVMFVGILALIPVVLSRLQACINLMASGGAS